MGLGFRVSWAQGGMEGSAGAKPGAKSEVGFGGGGGRGKGRQGIGGGLLGYAVAWGPSDGEINMGC